MNNQHFTIFSKTKIVRVFFIRQRKTTPQATKRAPVHLKNQATFCF